MDKLKKRGKGDYGQLSADGELESVSLVGGNVEHHDDGDHSAAQHRPLPARESAGTLSRILFSWVRPLLVMGKERQLNVEDLFRLPDDCNVDRLADSFHDALKRQTERDRAERRDRGLSPQWDEEKPKKGFHLPSVPHFPPVFHALRDCVGGEFVRAGVYKACNDCLQFLPAVVLSNLLQAVSGRHTHLFARMGAKGDRGPAIVYAIFLFVFPVSRTLVEQAYFYRVQKVNMKVKAMLTTAVYRKAVVLSSASKQASSTGSILNHMQQDASRIAELVTYLHVIWSAGLQIVGYVSLLYGYIGWSVFGGLTVMVVLMPVQNRVFRLIGKRRKAQMALSDKRVKLQNEALSGVKILKLNAWEEPMADLIGKVRQEELATARSLAYINAFVSALISTSPILVAVGAFTLYTAVMGQKMSAWVVFPSLTLFSQLRFPVMFFPRVLSMSADALVSLARLQKFLQLPETASAAPPTDHSRLPVTSRAEPGSVVARLKRGSFHFNDTEESGEAPFLKLDSDVEIRRGELVVCVGSVGSGKSALATALLGELWPVSGAEPEVRGRVAYVAQTAWVQSSTLRENVTFGLPFDEERYERAVEAACLGPDVELLPNGHETEIGEKGITLSGGQKQRVAIARAVYADADLYVFDDPLSALDSHVSKRLFKECMCSVLRDKAILLVTHSLSVVPEADRIIVMGGGRIVEQGTFAELSAVKGGVFAELMVSHGPQPGAAEGGMKRNKSSAAELDGKAAASASQPNLKKTQSGKSAGDMQKMIKDEKREEGSIKWQVFDSYAKAFPGGWVTIALLLCSNFAKQACAIGTMLWLAVWSGAKMPGFSDFGYLAVYAFMSVLSAVVTYIKSVLWTFFGLKAAGKLHSQLFHAVLNTRMTFFDVTPLGRILQRFSKDTDQLDNNLPASWNMTTEFITGLLSQLTTMCSIQPLMIPFLAPIGYLYFNFQAFFRASYREIKRLDSTTGSPVYAHFSETLAGLVTIRAFGHQERFISDNAARVATNQKAFYTQRCACDRWLPVRLESVGNSIVLVVALLAVAAEGTRAAAMSGLVLSFSLDITGLLSWVIRQWSETESAMVSVERVSEYASLPSEEETGALLRGGVADTPFGWPSSGALRVDTLSLRYQPAMPLVLNAVTFDVASGEKVGLVGRTGSGKSTMLTALWRLVEPEHGSMWLDGVNTLKLKLSVLRGAITCIPQDPVLFSGTVRHNLDPAGTSTHSDYDLWRALEAVQLKQHISAEGKGLDMPVTEFGENFSAGQRQLLCLSRALLRESRVVCLDEATASVDLETDQMMQKVIKEKFASCTVLTVAHRIHTIIDADTVLCFDAGRLVGKGSPHSLLQDPGSVFFGLVEETGEASAAMLRQRAAEKQGITLPAPGVQPPAADARSPFLAAPAPVPLFEGSLL